MLILMVLDQVAHYWEVDAVLKLVRDLRGECRLLFATYSVTRGYGNHVPSKCAIFLINRGEDQLIFTPIWVLELHWVVVFHFDALQLLSIANLAVFVHPNVPKAVFFIEKLHDR